MVIISDILLVAASLAAAFYCYILGRRLRKFNNLEAGMGGAVAVLSAQVDDLQKSLKAAQTVTGSNAAELSKTIIQAEAIYRKLELQTACFNDIVGENAIGEGTFPPAVSKKESNDYPEPMFVRRRVTENMN